MREKKILKLIKKHLKEEKSHKNKLFLNIKNKYYNYLGKIVSFTHNEKAQEILTAIKSIVSYGLIGYFTFHAYFIRTNLILMILGFGSSIYLFMDLFNYVLQELKKFRKEGKWSLSEI